jgi:vacuolar protein sorting-associated protein VTA1
MRGLGELGEEIEERIRYAKWKASDIVKALNEGRQPQSGPPGSSPPPQEVENLNEGGGNLPSMSGQFQSGLGSKTTSETVTTSSHTMVDTTVQRPTDLTSTVTDTTFRRTSPPIVLPAITVPGPVTVQSTQSSPPLQIPAAVSPVVDPLALSTAEKHARFAISAIQFEDVTTAISNLESALNILHSLPRK